MLLGEWEREREITSFYFFFCYVPGQRYFIHAMQTEIERRKLVKGMLNVKLNLYFAKAPRKHNSLANIKQHKENSRGILNA